MRTRSLLLSVALVGCANDIQVSDKANVAPAASINSPSDGFAATSGVNVEFVGQATDADGLDDIQTASWISSVDGELIINGIAQPDNSGVSRFSTVLSPGVHAITFRLVDTAGEVGEANISVSIGDAVVAPTIEIAEPALFEDFFLSETVDLVATVADEQSPSDEIEVVWTAEGEDGNVTTVLEGFASLQGLAIGSWTPLEVGGYVLTATATDPEGNMGTASVAIDVEDPSGLDVDGDGVPASSDCDDNDPYAYPGAEEICGDAIDNDCSGVVDDKDEDNDQHVDEDCVNYPGKLPVDDCNDDQSQVFPGASESPDGFDNDCDGLIDEDTPSFDDDGDCFCEVGPCTGSVEPLCPTVEDGDCVDDDDLAYPGAFDEPDMSFVDGNCDGVDGDAADMVFLDPIGGSDADSGELPTEAVRSWGVARSKAAASGRSWVAIAEGDIDLRSLTAGFEEGLNLAGGYDASLGWERNANTFPVLELPSTGKAIDGWSDPTEWQLLDIIADDASATGASSIALRISNSDNLLLTRVLVEAGDGVSGSNGSSGGTGTTGPDGGAGGNSAPESSGFFGACGGPDPQPVAGSGGAGGPDGTGAGGAGGRGGSKSGSPNQTSGSGGVGPGGNGGSAAGSFEGSPGSAGLQGADGSGGSPGFGFGSVNSSGYIASSGGTGGLGGTGGGGGGGGGGDGGEDDITCDQWGGSGGGGGGGGRGGSGGAGGTGGGASIAIVLSNSVIVLEDAEIVSRFGGDGGNGGTGGSGGSGGDGGNGGSAGGSLLFSEPGPGGAGGPGGQGGRGGHGGGGGGGPSVGVACANGSTVVATGVSYSVGSGGTGGGGPGSPGVDGEESELFECL